MSFKVLNTTHHSFCNVVIIKIDTIEVKRRAQQIFHFKDPERFLDAITGGKQVAIYVGKVKMPDGTEKWCAYHWNPSDPKKDTWGSSDSMLPLGTIAWLEEGLENEFGLDWLLKERQKDAFKFADLTRQAEEWSRKIRRVDDDNQFARMDSFSYMGIEELEKTVEDMKAEHHRLTTGVALPQEQE